MLARIYQPPRSAMQSGTAHDDVWLLEFHSPSQQVIDPLTGTVRSTNTDDQIELKFASAEDAVAYCKKHDIPHRVIPAKRRARIRRAYADNFATDRRQPWTH